METSQYVTFTVDDLLWGVAITDVQEILPPQPLTPVPLSPVGIRGLLNLRGQVIAAVDFRTCLECKEQSCEAKAVHAILRLQDEVFSLLVDSVGDVIEVGEDCFEPIAAVIPEVIARSASRVCKLESQLMLELSTDALMQNKFLREL